MGVPTTLVLNAIAKKLTGKMAHEMSNSGWSGTINSINPLLQWLSLDWW